MLVKLYELNWLFGMVEISLIRFFSQLDDLFYLVCWNKTPISTAIIDLCVWLDLMTPVSTAILDLCVWLDLIQVLV